MRRLLSVLLLAGVASSACAADPITLDTIKVRGTLRVGTPGDYRPFAIHNPDGSYEGADIDMAKGFAGKLGVRLEIVPTEWAKLQGDFDAGNFDIAIGGITITPDRAAKGDFSVALLEDGKRPVVRCADKDKFISVAAIDQPGTRVVVNPGAANEAFARANFHRAPITVNPENITVADQIVANRADVWVTDGIEVDLVAKRHAGVLCAAAVPAPFTHLTKAWYFPKDPGLKQAIDGYLAPAKVDGTWAATLEAAMK
ncbi:MAG: Cyclohexadienyl dehydratase [Rhodospirillales bacterium]|nr:Cyclohexadienyl dehydratase [Rhodospirillales bacterium]